MTLVSGMLLKKAVVATNSAGAVNYMKDGWNGLLYEAHSPTDMAEKIRTLWEEPDTARVDSGALRYNVVKDINHTQF
jgi:glycosyltransferase involved in cell wall biosynthesis